MHSIITIGFVKSSRTLAEDDFWADQIAHIELVPPFTAEALIGLDQFSHAEILFLFHKVEPAEIEFTARHPRGNTAWPRVGIFAQRRRNRPNRTGVSIAEIISVENTCIALKGLDAIDGTPILDIKPVMAEFLPQEQIRQPAWSHELMRRYWR